MVNVKITSNFQSVIKDLAREQAKRDKAVDWTLLKIAQTSFKDIEQKSITQVRYEDGNVYKPAPDANMKKIIKRNGKQYFSKRNYFSSTKIISRSGELFKSVQKMAIGAISSTDYLIKHSKNKLEIYAITTKAIVLEVAKAGPHNARNIIKKTFRRAVNIFVKTLKKALK